MICKLLSYHKLNEENFDRRILIHVMNTVFLYIELNTAIVILVICFNFLTYLLISDLLKGRKSAVG